MKNDIYMLAVFILASFTSCEKYLDAKPKRELATPTTLVALQALMDDGQYINTTSPSFGEASADDYYISQTSYNTRPPLTQQAYVWNAANLSTYIFSESPDWGNVYYVIYIANTCLEQLEKIEKNTRNETSWNNVKGSALFLRARSFLQLAWIHSKAYDPETASQDLGIPLRLTSDINVQSFRSNLKDTYAQIIVDFKESVDLLPTLPEHVTRPSKAASYAYLARTYLSVRNYDSAYRYADLSLQLKNDLIDYNDNSVVNIESTRPFAQFNKEVVYHYYNNTYAISSILQRFARIDSNLYNLYSGDDLRKTAFFSPNPDGYSFKGSYSNSTFTGVTTSELYLTRAECAARAGIVSAAIDDLNRVLIMRWKAGAFINFDATDANDALEKILTERRKELVFRDLRWMDIKRLNKEGRNISITRVINSQTYTLPPNDNRFALPLPTDIINLSGMPQNPY